MTEKISTRVFIIICFIVLFTLSYIDPNLIYSSECDVVIDPKSNSSIQKVVNDASPNSVICLESGTYHEEVKINNPNITLTAAPGGKPVIDGKYALPKGREGRDPRYNNQSLIQIRADNVTVEGLTVENSLGRGIAVGVDGGTMIRNVKILNNTVIGSRVQGIGVDSTIDTLVKGNLIEYSGTKNFLPDTPLGGGQLNVQDSEGTIITENIVRYGVLEGIVVDANRGGSTNSLISNNILHDNRSASLYSHGTDHAEWVGNLVFVTDTNPYYDSPYARCFTGRVIEFDDAADISKRVFEDIRVHNNIFWGCPNLAFTASMTTVDNMLYKDVYFTHNTVVTAYNSKSDKYTSIKFNNVGGRGSKFQNVQINYNLFSLNDKEIDYTPIITNGDFSGVSFKGNLWSVDPKRSNDMTTSDTRLVGQDGKGTFKVLEELPPGGYEEIRSWFQLKEDSPAVNAASGSNENKDHMGSTRDDQPDIGAVEFGATDTGDFDDDDPTRDVDETSFYKYRTDQKLCTQCTNCDQNSNNLCRNYENTFNLDQGWNFIAIGSDLADTDTDWLFNQISRSQKPDVLKFSIWNNASQKTDNVVYENKNVYGYPLNLESSIPFFVFSKQEISIEDFYYPKGGGTYDVKLRNGWNSIVLNEEESREVKKASEIVSKYLPKKDLPNYSKVFISNFKEDKQVWDTFIYDGNQYGTDFNVLPGEPYLLYLE